MAQCFNCNAEVIWQNDFSYEDYGYEGEGIVSVWVCSKCGAVHEVSIPINGGENNE